MNFPTDRKFVDADGKIRDPWLGPLNRLAPLLDLTNADFTVLKQLIAAASDQSDASGGGTINIFALPIDNSPLFTEDYLVGTKTSENSAGRRYPLSLFTIPSVITRISTTTLSGSSVDISLPTGYTDVLFIVKGASPSGGATFQVRFSEDGGATFQTHAQKLTQDASNIDNSAVSTGQISFGGTFGSSSSFWGQMRLYNYTSSITKGTSEHWMQNSSNEVGVGGRVLNNSVAAINLVRFALSANSFAAGTIELWGIP